MKAFLDEIVEKFASLTSEERRELMQLLQEEEKKIERNERQADVSVNTIWLRENKHQYGGMYVAIEDGKLVGKGKNFREADKTARENGSQKPFITYVFPPDSEPFGGW